MRTTLIAASGFCFGSVNVPRRIFSERGQGSKFKSIAFTEFLVDEIRLT
jgi:hypothetical protein